MALLCEGGGFRGWESLQSPSPDLFLSRSRRSPASLPSACTQLGAGASRLSACSGKSEEG